MGGSRLGDRFVMPRMWTRRRRAEPHPTGPRRQPDDRRQTPASNGLSTTAELATTSTRAPGPGLGYLSGRRSGPDDRGRVRRHSDRAGSIRCPVVVVFWPVVLD